MPTGKEFGIMPNNPTSGVIGIPILEMPGIQGLDNIGTSHLRLDNSLDRVPADYQEAEIAPLVGKGDLNDELCDLEGFRNMGGNKDTHLKKDDMDKYQMSAKVTIPDVFGKEEIPNNQFKSVGHSSMTGFNNNTQ